MAETQVVKNGVTPTNPAVAGPTLAELQAQLADLAGKLADQMAENKRLRETPQVVNGAMYGTIPPSGKYLTPAFKMSLPSGGQIIGPRVKFVELIDEVTSGRLQANLNAHPEVK